MDQGASFVQTKSGSAGLILNGSFLTIACTRSSVLDKHGRNSFPDDSAIAIESHGNHDDSSQLIMLNNVELHDEDDHVSVANQSSDGQGDHQIQLVQNSRTQLQPSAAILDIVSRAVPESGNIEASILDVTNSVPVSGGMLRLVDINGTQRFVCIQGSNGNSHMNAIGSQLTSFPGADMLVNGDAAITSQSESMYELSLIDESVANLVSKTSGSDKPAKNKGGWPKGRKRKPHHGMHIKAPASGYVIFARQRRKELAKLFPYYTFSEVTRMMGAEWTKMDVAQKNEYLEKAGDDKKRFMEEMKAYKETESYHNIVKRKRLDQLRKNGDLQSDGDENGDLDCDHYNIDIEDELHCRICDQYFSSSHNKQEHLLGKQHLNKLQQELAIETPPTDPSISSDKAVGPDGAELPRPPTEYEALDIEAVMEDLMHRNLQRDFEIQALREIVNDLKETNAALNKDLATYKDSEMRLKSEVQGMKQWSAQLTRSIENLKMVPTLFGVINF